METALTYLLGEPADQLSMLDITERNITITAAGGVQQVAPLDGERVFIGVYVPNPGGSMRISTRSDLLDTTGIPLVSSPPFERTAWLHPGQPQLSWVARVTIDAGVTVFEVFYRRRTPLRSPAVARKIRIANALTALRRWCGNGG